MKHRLQIDIAFATKQDAMDLINHIENIKTKAYKPKGTEKITCIRSCRYHACTHDDPNPQPCGSYVNIDFDGQKQTHT